MAQNSPLRIRYDKYADVLYVSFERKPADHGVEDQFGIVWRYDANGGIIGATVMGFHDKWNGDRGGLAHQMAGRLGVSEPVAASVVEDAFALQ